MFYIRQLSTISPQLTFLNDDLEQLNTSSDNKLKAIEPSYEEIPRNILRRMGKAVRISVGAALPLLKSSPHLDGIIIGTANGGMEDCVKFMNEIIQYDEGLLSPGNFVQSTPNGLAAQIALLQNNKGYNITHVHRGLSFENAMIDAALMLRENPEAIYLLGAVDEISAYNYNVDFLDGWYKHQTVSNKELYNTDSPASIAGEGAAMFLVSAQKTNTLARVLALQTVHGNDMELVLSKLKKMIAAELMCQWPDILITGENGDNRLLSTYETVEALLPEDTLVLRFKHMTGEYPTASSQALGLACHLLTTQTFPKHMIKKRSSKTNYKTVLIYTNYKGMQHSLMIVSLGE